MQHWISDSQAHLLYLKRVPSFKQLKQKVNFYVFEIYFVELWIGPATILKKRCFIVNFVKFLRTPFLQTTSSEVTQDLIFTKKYPIYKFPQKLLRNVRH